MEYRMKVHSSGEIMGFVEAAKGLQGSCEVVSGGYRVNAKSLMAMLAIPDTADMTLQLADEAEELPEVLLNYLIVEDNYRT